MADSRMVTLAMILERMEKWSCVDFSFLVQNRGKFIWRKIPQYYVLLYSYQPMFSKV